jgi:hypothetical protein
MWCYTNDAALREERGKPLQWLRAVWNHMDALCIGARCRYVAIRIRLSARYTYDLNRVTD